MSIQSVNGLMPNLATSPTTPARQPAPGVSGSATEIAQSSTPSNVTQAAVQDTKKSADSRNELDKAVKDVSEFVKTANNSLQFSIDDDLGVTVVKVIDTGTKELIRQIPSEEMLSIAKALGSIKGLLVRQKA